MPRGRLTEKYVKEAALKKLVSYYQKRLKTQKVLFEEEVIVKKRKRRQGGRADGLIIVQRSDDTIFTASLEAKSSRTLWNIYPLFKDEKWVLHTLIVGLVGLIVAGFIGWSIGGWFWIWGFPLLVFIIVAITYMLVTADYDYYRPIEVIAQVKRYPADERWIAVSTDVYNRLGEEQRTLRKDCHKGGIGLIRVSAGKKTNILEHPRSQKLPRGLQDFLACYARESMIRAKLQASQEN